MSIGRYCRSCAYDLRESDARCPECGRAFDPANPRTYARKPPRVFIVRWLRRIALVLLVLVLSTSSTWGWFYWGWSCEQAALASMGTVGRQINVGCKPIGGPEIQRYLGSAGFVLDRVRDLDVPWIAAQTFTDDRMDWLPGLKYLIRLRLSHTRITDAGLACVKGLRNLEVIELTNTSVTDAGVSALAQLPKLRRVDVSQTHATAAAVRMFPPRVWVSAQGLPKGEGVPGSLGCTLPVPLASGPDPLANAQSHEVAYKPRGSLDAMRWYFLPGEKVGERIFYDNGGIAEERLFRNGLLQGHTRQFYRSGKLFAEYPYEKGKLHGDVRFYKEDGALLGESRFDNGTGVLRQYALRPLEFSAGELPYRDGVLDGVKRTFARFDFGNGCECTQFVQGEMEGWSVVLDQTGTLISSAYFHNGKLHGIHRRFSAADTLASGYPEFYIDDRSVSEEAFRQAVRTDEVLARSLTDTGLAWGRKFMPSRIADYLDQPNEMPPTAKPGDVHLYCQPARYMRD